MQVTLHNHQHAQICPPATFAPAYDMCILKSETLRYRSCAIHSSIDQIASEERTREVQQFPKLHLESRTVSTLEWLHRVSSRGPPFSGRSMMT